MQLHDRRGSDLSQLLESTAFGSWGRLWRQELGQAAVIVADPGDADAGNERCWISARAAMEGGVRPLQLLSDRTPTKTTLQY